MIRVLFHKVQGYKLICERCQATDVELCLECRHCLKEKKHLSYYASFMVHRINLCVRISNKEIIRNTVE